MGGFAPVVVGSLLGELVLVAAFPAVPIGVVEPSFGAPLTAVSLLLAPADAPSCGVPATATSAPSVAAGGVSFRLIPMVMVSSAGVAPARQLQDFSQNILTM